jgi:hypothetical protein
LVTEAGNWTDRPDRGTSTAAGIGETIVDFVVAGFGLGAVLMLIGFAVRDFGPLRHRANGEDESVSRPWAVLCGNVGTALVAAGLMVCLVTLVLLVVGAGDNTGARLVVAVAAVALIGSGVWSVLAVRRYTAVIATLAPAIGMRRGWGTGPAARPSFRPAERAEWTAPEVDVEAAEERRPATLGEIQALWPTPPEDTRRPVEEESALEGPPAPLLTSPAAPEPSPAPDIRGSVFASPLLANVGTNSASDNGSGFRSSLLADVTADDRGEASKGGFASSILADLEGDRDDRAVSEAVFGPPLPSRSPEVASIDAGRADLKADPLEGTASEAGEQAARETDAAPSAGIEPEAGEVGEAAVVPVGAPSSRD